MNRDRSMGLVVILLCASAIALIVSVTIISIAWWGR